MLCLRVYCSADSDSPDHFSDHEPLEDSASSYINLIHARQQSEMYGISQDVNADNENGDSDDSDFEGDPMCVDIESDVEMFVDSEEVTLIGPVDVSMVTENSGVCLCPFCRLLSYWFSVHDTRIAKFLRSITCENYYFCCYGFFGRYIVCSFPSFDYFHYVGNRSVHPSCL